MRIGIRSLLLIILMPMVVVPLAIIGTVVVVQTGTFTSEARRVVGSLGELQELARIEFATLSDDLNRRQADEGRIIAQRLGRAVQVRIDELRRIAEVLGPSPVVTAYVTAEAQNRSLLNRQTISFLDGIVETYELSTIALLNPDGEEMLWRGRIVVPEGGDPLFDGEMLRNASEDESQSIWWPRAVAAREVVVTTHPCLDSPGHPMAIGISLPLRYRAGAYAPRGGQLAGVLHLTVPLPELLANLIGNDGAARLESEDGTLLAAHGDIGSNADMVVIRAGESVAGMIPVLLIDGSQLAASLARLGRLTEGLDQRIHGAGEAAARVSEGAEALTSTVLWVLLAASLLGAFVALWVANRLAKPIIELSQRADGLRRGRADAIHVTARMREIASLQQAMAGLALQLQQKAAYAQRVADGDLSLAQVAASEEDQLGLSLESMGRGLNDLITNISQANQEVDLVVEDLSEAAQTVADGACRQASALEQVSASMQEIGARAKTSASNAVIAATDAGQVRKAADDSGDRVQAMLAAMQRIQQAANRTMGVIKVIQDIAFQTNLLALNAAVEAARAGRHGKGFSVVAGEVRNLAARSAAAAKETSELLEAAVSAVGDGQTIAKQTAESIDGILKRISGVGDAVETLASEAGEQSAAVNQVAEGLQHINTVTIDTAAQADRAREASERLAQEAGRLRQEINRFQLDGAVPPTLPAPAVAKIESRKS